MFCDIHSIFGKVHKNSLCFTREISHKLCSQYTQTHWVGWQKMAEQLMKRMDEENGWNPLFIVPTGSNGSQRVPTGPNGFQQVWGGGGGMINDPSCWGGGGQYKMYKSIIFINCEHNLCDISLVKHSEFLWTFPKVEWMF